MTEQKRHLSTLLSNLRGVVFQIGRYVAALSEEKQLHTALRVAVVTSTCLSCSHPSLPWSALLVQVGWRLWLLEPLRKRGWQGGGKEADSSGNAPLRPKTDIVSMWESLGEERGKHLGDGDGRVKAGMGTLASIWPTPLQLG